MQEVVKYSEELEKVERFANASKIQRLFRNPLKYFRAVFFRDFLYRFTLKEKLVSCKTYFKKKFHVLLPASIDIYLSGGKTHNSEIRLAKYLTKELKEGDTFFDVGAHFGFFSMLGSSLVGKTGHVFSFEASPRNYGVLKINTETSDNIHSIHRAVSDTNERLSFHEFPIQYSEYNTLHVEQYEGSDWIKKYKPRKVDIDACTLDQFVDEKKLSPSVLKIDVEGAEYKVLNGMKNYLQDHDVSIIMEFVDASRSNEEHMKADRLLKTLGFTSNVILADGSIQLVKDINKHLESNTVPIPIAKMKILFYLHVILFYYFY